jgi:HTH-type transcriptional regulator / antitoxin HigA
MITRNSKPIPARATHPGEILHEELHERGIKQEQFAQMIDMTPAFLDNFVNGKYNLDKEFAKKLESHLKIPYEIWMNLQIEYNEDIKEIEKMPNV